MVKFESIRRPYARFSIKFKLTLVLFGSVASAKTKSTGTLWEHCDGFQHLPAGRKFKKKLKLKSLWKVSNLPKDTLWAVCKTVRTTALSAVEKTTH